MANFREKLGLVLVREPLKGFPLSVKIKIRTRLGVVLEENRNFARTHHTKTIRYMALSTYINCCCNPESPLLNYAVIQKYHLHIVIKNNLPIA